MINQTHYEVLGVDAKEKLQDSPLYFEKENSLKHAYQVLSSPSEFLGGLIFSKAFLGSIVVIIVLLVIIPSGEERIAGDVIHKSLDYDHDINNQKMGLENRREDRYVSNQDYIETRGMREQGRLETSDERDRKAERYEKRQKELEAQRLSRERIRNIQRAGELQRDVNRLKAGY